MRLVVKLVIAPLVVKLVIARVISLHFEINGS